MNHCILNKVTPAQQVGILPFVSMEPAPKVIVLALCALFAGCTQLQSVRVTDQTPIPPAGVPYNLTFTQFDIKLTRRLTACPNTREELEKLCKPQNVNDRSATQQIWKTVPETLSASPEFADFCTNAEKENARARKATDGKPTGSAPGDGYKIDVLFESSAIETRDPMREYVIDFLSLRSFFKTTGITVGFHPNGALSTVNANAEDKTGDFISKVASIAGSTLAARVQQSEVMTVSGQRDSVKTSPDQCKRDVAQAVALKPFFKAATEKHTGKQDSCTRKLVYQMDLVRALGQGADRRSRDNVRDAMDCIQQSGEQLAKYKLDLQQALKMVSENLSARWPADGESGIKLDSSAKSGQSTPNLFEGLSNETLTKWFENHKSDAVKTLLGKDGLAIQAHIVPISPLGRHARCSTKACPDDQTAGLKYRMPVPGTLELSIVGTEAGPQHQSTVPISQLGPVMTLPLKNYPFMNQTITAKFNDAGQPLEIGYTSEAAATKAADALDSVVDQALKVREARKPKSELEKMQDELALLKARKDIDDAKKALSQPTDDAVKQKEFEADAAVLNAELTKIRAEIALKEAREQLGKLP